MYVVIAKLAGPPEHVIVVSLTTKRSGSDETVVLTTGDHPFITHDTAINYSDSREFLKSDLVDRINQKFFKPSKTFSNDKVKIIQQGLLSSPHTPNDIKSQCASILDD